MNSDRAEFQERLHASALSRWELGDLLGVHPHLLPEYGPGSLGHLPARLVVEVARYLDMHPADLVVGLDTVLHHPRLHNRPEPADPDAAADLDALTVLTALATATAPLTTDQVADVLAWTIERVTTALDRATTTPQLAGPFALRHVAANTYTVTPRLDLLTGDERPAAARDRPLEPAPRRRAGQRAAGRPGPARQRVHRPARPHLRRVARTPP